MWSQKRRVIMTFKIGKTVVITLAILGILAVVYNVLFFAIPWKREVSETSFWITYGCTWLAFIFVGIITAIAFNKRNLKSRIFGIPIHFVGYVVVLFQFLLDFIVMSVGSFYEVWWWVPTVVEVLIFGLNIIAVVARQAYRNFIDKVDDKKVKKTYTLQLKMKLNFIIDLNTIDEIKTDLEQLAEAVRYTDPVSCKEVENTEDRITVVLEELEKAIVDNDIDKSKTLIAKINRFLNERKAILKSVR